MPAPASSDAPHRPPRPRSAGSQRRAQTPCPLPTVDGLSPSCVALPPGAWATVLDFFCERFAQVARADWVERMQAGRVVDAQAKAVTPERAYAKDLRVWYYRELPHEPAMPGEARIVFQDDWLIVADKPHFLPVIPSGRYVRETLLVRLKQQLGMDSLVPIHRIDRDTAGLVLLSVRQATRGAYQGLFRDRRITKHYDAIAPWRADIAFPRDHVSRLEESPQFFRMHEVPGEPNSHTHMQVAEVAADGAWARYRLSPVTGKRHQLRVHMAALGAPILHDRFYPQLQEQRPDDQERPLQLFAHALAFEDPITGKARCFTATRGPTMPA